MAERESIVWRGPLLFYLFVLAADQLTKFVAEAEMDPGESVTVIPGLFDFTLVYNPGAAFGLFSGLADGARHLSLLTVSIIALIVVVRFLLVEAREDVWARYALLGILAGALGNIIDRLRLDAVVDFLDVYLGDSHWPAFNIADSAISVGVVILVIRMLFFATEAEPEDTHRAEEARQLEQVGE